MVKQTVIDKIILDFNKAGYDKLVAENKSFLKIYLRDLETSGEIQNWTVDSNFGNFRFSLIDKEEKVFIVKESGGIEILN